MRKRVMLKRHTSIYRSPRIDTLLNQERLYFHEGKNASPRPLWPGRRILSGGKKAIAQEVMNTLGIAPLVRSIVIEKGDTPWSEKALIKWKKDHLDVKAIIWDDPTFLYGRIYCLFLYIVDVLNPVFEYKPRMSPDEEIEPKVRDRYNQIWSIYVDSRMERLGIENFYDRSLRKNLFIDSEKDFSWDAAGAIFQILWKKEFYTYPEIIDYSYDLSKIKIPWQIDTFEKEVSDLLQDSSVKKHLERILINGIPRDR